MLTIFRQRLASPQEGFTIVEMVVVIVITGIIAAIVAVFIRRPVEGYFDAARRATLTEVADSTLRRIAREIHLALPNSVRVTSAAGVYYLEFLQTSDGGRYRAEDDNSGPGDALSFNAADTSFDVLGPPIVLEPGAQNLIAVYNLGVPGSDAYNGDNTSAVTGIAGNNIQIASKLFPFASPGNRFQLISYPVSYVCDPGTGTLTRHWNYPIQAVQPTTFASGSSAILATKVTACAFVYQTGVTERSGLASLQLTVGESGEFVSLYHEVHVSNVP